MGHFAIALDQSFRISHVSNISHPRSLRQSRSLIFEGGMPREQANGGIAAGGGGVMRRGNRMAGAGPGEVMGDAST